MTDLFGSNELKLQKSGNFKTLYEKKKKLVKSFNTKTIFTYIKTISKKISVLQK